MAAFDPAQLNRLAPSPFSGTGYRNQAPGFDPRSGDGARRFGGRFNPARSFSVIYLCLTRPCAVAELTSQAARQSVAVADLLPRELWAVRVDLERVLDLTDVANLDAGGISTEDLVRPDHGFTQQIGEAAHERGYQAIHTPSATGIDQVLAVFPENLGGSVIEVELIDRWEAPDALG